MGVDMIDEVNELWNSLSIKDKKKAINKSRIYYSSILYKNINDLSISMKKLCLRCLGVLHD